MTLVEFLLARIGEDEPSPYEGRCFNGEIDDYTKRLRAECAAKRRIIELHEPNEYQPTQCRSCGYRENWEVRENGPTFPCETLRLLALPYADHPDYDETWRP